MVDDLQKRTELSFDLLLYLGDLREASFSQIASWMGSTCNLDTSSVRQLLNQMVENGLIGIEEGETIQYVSRVEPALVRLNRFRAMLQEMFANQPGATPLSLKNLTDFDLLETMRQLTDAEENHLD